MEFNAGMGQWPQTFERVCFSSENVGKKIFAQSWTCDYWFLIRRSVSEAKRWLHTDRVFTACLTPLRARWGSLITESPALLSVLAPHASAATPAPFRTASTSARENSSHSCSSVIRGLAAARGQRSHTAEFMFTLACRIFRITLEGGGKKKQHLIESAFLGSKCGHQYWDPRHQESESCRSVKTSLTDR